MKPLMASTEWLAEHLGRPGLVVLDASWYLPGVDRDPKAEYLESHIPGAVFFGIDDIADKTTTLPHMLPPPEDFAHEVGALGISEQDTIVVYDEAGVTSAPRVWWEFTVMGAHDVRVLDGGGRKWRAEGRPTERGAVRPRPKIFHARPNVALAIDYFGVLNAMTSKARTIVDARPAERFNGTAPEPRPGLASGHIPGSINVPAAAVTTNGCLKSPDELRALFEAAGIDLRQPIVTSCGSGITAATLALALEAAGAEHVAVYDGSWAEWGGRSDAPIER